MQEPMKRTDSASAKSDDLKSEVGTDDPALIRVQFCFDLWRESNFYSFAGVTCLHVQLFLSAHIFISTERRRFQVRKQLFIDHQCRRQSLLR